MKSFFRASLALLALFAFCGVVRSQSYESLVQKETVSIVKINLDQIDSQSLAKSIQKIGNGAVDYFLPGNDENATQFKQLVPIAGMFVSQAYSTNVEPLKEAGVKELYVVVDQAKDENEKLYPYVAVPVEGLQKEQKDEIRNALQGFNKMLPQDSQYTLKYRFERSGFIFNLIVPSELSQDDVKAYMKSRFQKIATVEATNFVDGFKAAPAKAALSGVNLKVDNDELAQKQIDDAFAQIEENADADALKMFKDSIGSLVNLNEELSQKVKYNYWWVDLQALEVVSVIQANSNDDAKEYVDVVQSKLVAELNSMFDKLASSVADSEDSSVTDDQKELAKKAVEQAKPVVAAFMTCSVDGSKVVWKINEKFWTDNKPVFDEFVRFIREEVLAKMKTDDVDNDEDDDEGDIEFDAL